MWRESGVVANREQAPVTIEFEIERMPKSFRKSPQEGFIEPTPHHTMLPPMPYAGWACAARRMRDGNAARLPAAPVPGLCYADGHHWEIPD
jgi:hypothetical protein